MEIAINIALVSIFLPIPMLMWVLVYCERKRLHRVEEKEELIDKMRGNKSWKKRILK